MPTPPDSSNPKSFPSATVRLMDESDMPAARSFLEAHIDTSVYLLSTMTELGIRSTSSPRSGNVLLIEEGGDVVGVFCLTLKGDLLAQAGGRAMFAPLILDACRSQGPAVVGVLAEWPLAEALWALLSPDLSYAPVYECKSVVYGITRVPMARPVPGIVVREMTMADYDAWEPLDRAFCAEEGLAVMPENDRRRSGYQLRADVGGWWGAFAEARLVSTACLNAEYRGIGQVGGVYTRPAYRRLGIAQQVMHELMRAHEARTGLQEVVLFAAERNLAACAFYEAMGFDRRGGFGLLFRRPVEQR